MVEKTAVLHSQEGMEPKPWNAATNPPESRTWVEAKLPDGSIAVARWTSHGWLPLYPAGTPRAWRPRNGERYRTLPYSPSA